MGKLFKLPESLFFHLGKEDDMNTSFIIADQLGGDWGKQGLGQDITFPILRFSGIKFNEVLSLY